MKEILRTADKSSPVAVSPSPERPLALRIWLWCVAAMIFAIVVVGGATRLTESGLSITEWKPISGIIPPLSQQGWLAEFEKFKQIPQYNAIFSSMNLSGFKFIFFWEFSHRLLARSIGVVVGVPLFIFWLRKMIPQGYLLKLIGLLALVGFEGVLGWWMVSSGLVDRIDVAQERLAAHLTVASFAFALTVHLATSLKPSGAAAVEADAGLRRFAGVMIALTFVQIFLGALVAGLRAGRAFNTWPLMDGDIVPAGLLALEPLWRNFLDNIALVQFQHRFVAYVLFGLALVQVLFTFLRLGTGRIFRRALHVAALVVVQAGLGITTLVLVVPLWAALLHQAFAMIVLASVVRHRARLVREAS
jgi:cytochrome c oxidase assembly protein subunit 15